MIYTVLSSSSNGLAFTAVGLSSYRALLIGSVSFGALAKLSIARARFFYRTIR
jgi:hypothetical protein